MNLFKEIAKIPHDKLLHSFYGTLIYAVVSVFNPILAIIVTLIVAVSKEVMDEIKYKGFDWKDIIATICIPTVFLIRDLI